MSRIFDWLGHHVLAPVLHVAAENPLTFTLGTAGLVAAWAATLYALTEFCRRTYPPLSGQDDITPDTNGAPR